MLHVVTYATHADGNFDNLINNHYGITITVVGWNTKWEGYSKKLKVILDYISSLDDMDIVIIIDGFDVYVNNYISIAEEYFKNCNCNILFSQNIDLDQWANSYFTKQIFSCKSPCSCINAGMYMGYVKSIKYLYKLVLTESTCKDDQRTINNFINDGKLQNTSIDTDKIVFENLTNINYINDSNAVFVSNPGTHSKTRVIRAVKEYSQFFFKEYIFISIMFFVFLKIYKKKIDIKIILIHLFITLLLYNTIDNSCT